MPLDESLATHVATLSRYNDRPDALRISDRERRRTKGEHQDFWHSWKRCAPPDDLVKEIEEIARVRQCRPREVLWTLAREALAHRRGAGKL